LGLSSESCAKDGSENNGRELHFGIFDLQIILNTDPKDEKVTKDSLILDLC
jgi:hypothetical protein